MWWETLNKVELITLMKLLENQGTAWYNVRAAAIRFVTDHQTVEMTKNILEWIGR